MAEDNHILCRDDGPNGLRFYHNFFQQEVTLGDFFMSS